MNKTHVFLGLGVAAFVGATLLAQDPTTRPSSKPPEAQSPERTQTSDRAQQDTNRVSEGDYILAQWLLIENENEVELSRIAASRAQSPEVKQFAQKMVEDHTTVVQKLKAFSAKAEAAGIARGDRSKGEGQGNTGSDTSKAEPASGDRTGKPAEASATRTAVGEFDHLRLIRDLGKKCRESHTRILQEKQGAEFDRCFMVMAVGAHVKAVDTLEVFKNHASPALRPTLEEGLRNVQTHLQQAKDLAKSLDESKGGK